MVFENILLIIYNFGVIYYNDLEFYVKSST